MTRPPATPAAPSHATTTEHPHPNSQAPFTDQHRAWTYTTVLTAAATCYAALGVVLRLLPNYIHHTLHAGPAAVGLTVGAPALTAFVTRPLGGRAADRVGPAPVMLAGALLMSVALAPAYLSATLPTLVASRLLVGAGEGIMMSATVLWLLRIADPDRQGRALGHIGLANNAGLALGPLLANPLDPTNHPTRIFTAALLLPLGGAAVAATARRPPPPRAADRHHPTPHATRLVTRTLRPGIGLMAVNIGYVAVLSFGAATATSHHLTAATLIVPIFAATVIAARTIGASIPDRLGARRTVTGSVLFEAAGLTLAATATSTAQLIAGVVTLAAGIALAVPALGLLALADIPPAHHGAAAGTFFSYFDLGVGLGGPAIGLTAGAAGTPTALLAAAATVAAVAPLTNFPALRRPQPTADPSQPPTKQPSARTSEPAKTHKGTKETLPRLTYPNSSPHKDQRQYHKRGFEPNTRHPLGRKHPKQIQPPPTTGRPEPQM